MSSKGSLVAIVVVGAVGSGEGMRMMYDQIRKFLVDFNSADVFVWLKLNGVSLDDVRVRNGEGPARCSSGVPEPSVPWSAGGIEVDVNPFINYF